MTIPLNFDGSTEARGKNGWFQLRTIDINPYPDGVSVWVYSNKRGHFAPIYFKFHNPEELRTLICGLAKALAQMTQKEDGHGEVA